VLPGIHGDRSSRQAMLGGPQHLDHEVGDDDLMATQGQLTAHDPRATRHIEQDPRVRKELADGGSRGHGPLVAAACLVVSGCFQRVVQWHQHLLGVRSANRIGHRPPPIRASQGGFLSPTCTDVNRGPVRDRGPPGQQGSE
jgi:hypothetical protein